ncbi:hypothetical protein OIU83_04705 [Flavobacterium sp. LS1R49]|uniref:Uncharacterized protein n=1 Tax=Flavobacterium shii TaxID=2987687 RepID=A0A9X3BXS0_9FLAO|nr:hypothetical protein [Flavobacterium shii]MCV9926936.1 hypothetical protein [Flavobacterium shii]
MIKKNIFVFFVMFLFFNCKDTSINKEKEILAKKNAIENPKLVNDTIKDDKLITDNQIGNSEVNLPFDFEERDKLANSNRKKYLKAYPQLRGDKLAQIKKIILESSEDNPDEIFQINNGGLGFDSFVYCIYGDSDSQSLINIKNNKIIANESIGYAMPENETYQSFVINKDLTINIYDINYNSRSKKILEKHQIKQDGSITKIK